MAPTLNFCTFGMFIVDEIDYGDGNAIKTSIIGGAGIYAALGARLAAGPDNASTVSCIVDKGSDFPAEFQALIQQWCINCIFRTDLTRLTTRAWNGYGPNQHRAFKYLTPKRRLEVSSFTDQQALATTFHMVCSPTRCMDLVQRLRERRASLEHDSAPPIVIWEPIPDLCTPAELDNMREAATYVDVISPNGEELSDFFAPGDQTIDRSKMVAALLTKCGERPRQAVVVRDGADGSRLYFQNHIVHFRAYHQDASRVVDPTGGGNTYLGGLAMALSKAVAPEDTVLTQKLELLTVSPELLSMVSTVIHASIAASFAIEQVGTPAIDAHNGDIWNEESYANRWTMYVQREQAYLEQQLAD